MATSADIKRRARALGEKTNTESIGPVEVGNLIYDGVEYAEEVERNGGTLGIRKVYASVALMEADGVSPIDFWGKRIKKGNLVVVYDGTDAGVDNNKVYAFMGPGWRLVTGLDAGYATNEKLSELSYERKLSEGIDFIASIDTDNAFLYQGTKVDNSNYYIYKIEGTTVKYGKKIILKNLPTSINGGVTIAAAYDSENKYLGDLAFNSSLISSAVNSFYLDLSNSNFKNISYILVTVLKKDSLSLVISESFMNYNGQFANSRLSGLTSVIYKSGAFIDNNGILIPNRNYDIYKVEHLQTYGYGAYKVSVKYQFGSELPVIYAYDENDSPIGSFASAIGSGKSYFDFFNAMKGKRVSYVLICVFGSEIPLIFDYIDYSNSDIVRLITELAAFGSKEYPSIVTNEIIVDINGSGNFTSLTAAVNSIKDNSYYRRYIIRLLEGTYVVTDEYTPTGSTIGLVIPDYVSVIGVGNREKIVIKGELADHIEDKIKVSNSTLNIDLNSTIKHLTITAYNMRYCVHSDRPRGENTEITVEDCIMYHHGNPAYPDACWGMGTWSNSRRIFKNCIFNSKKNPAWATHDRNSGTDKPCYILLENCIFINREANLSVDIESEACSLIIQSLGDKNNSLIEINGCTGNLPLNIRPSYWAGGVNIKLDYDIIGHGNNLPIRFEREYTVGARGNFRKEITTRLSDEGIVMKNGTDNTIPLGAPVKMLSSGCVAIATDNENFFGIANQEIAVDSLGYVKNRGYFDVNDLNLPLEIGTKIGIVNGLFSKVADNPLFVVKYYGFINL